MAPFDGAAAERIAYFRSGPRLLLFFVVSTAFAALGIWVPLSDDSVPPLLLAADMVVVPVSGILAGVFLIRLVRPRPVLVIDDDGIAHHRFGRISWTEMDGIGIEAVRASMVSTQRLLVITLRDPAAYRARAGWRVRLSGTTSRLGTRRVIDVPVSRLSAPPADVIQALRQRRPDLWVG